jgi:hypothetical protein
MGKKIYPGENTIFKSLSRDFFINNQLKAIVYNFYKIFECTIVIFPFSYPSFSHDETYCDWLVTFPSTRGKSLDSLLTPIYKLLLKEWKLSFQVKWTDHESFFFTAIFYLASFIIRLLDGASYSGTRFCNLGKVKLNRYPPVLKSLNRCTVLRAIFFETG